MVKGPTCVQMASPMAGSFYRAPAPGEPSFCKEGDKVTKGQTVCIIEAMKLMNEIEVTAIVIHRAPALSIVWSAINPSNGASLQRYLRMLCVWHTLCNQSEYYRCQVSCFYVDLTGWCEWNYCQVACWEWGSDYSWTGEFDLQCTLQWKLCLSMVLAFMAYFTQCSRYCCHAWDGCPVSLEDGAEVIMLTVNHMYTGAVGHQAISQLTFIYVMRSVWN